MSDLDDAQRVWLKALGIDVDAVERKTSTTKAPSVVQAATLDNLPTAGSSAGDEPPPGDVPANLSDKERIDQLKRWEKAKKLTGNSSRLREQLRNSKDEDVLRRARERFDQIAAEIRDHPDARPTAREVATTPAVDTRGGPKQPLDKLLGKYKLTDKERHDFGKWLKDGHGEGDLGNEIPAGSKRTSDDPHEHMYTPDQVERMVDEYHRGLPAGTKFGNRPAVVKKSSGGKGPDADGGASKASKAALNAANRKLGGLMRDSQAKIAELAKSDPDAKELSDALDKTDTLQDAKSFMDDPKGFVAQKSKQALIDLPFNHFTERLEKSSADFQSRFPSVSDLKKTPLANGASLGEYERRYNQAAAQLRLPKARKVLLQAFVLLGVNESTPDKEVQARLHAADKMLAAMPQLSAYVKAYYHARTEYGFVQVMAFNKLEDLRKSYDTEVPRLSAGLRDRAGALSRISASLKEVADAIMDSPFIYFPPGEMAWFDFNHLAERFGDLGGRLTRFADLVEQRKTDYPVEMKRIEGEGQKMQRSLLEML